MKKFKKSIFSNILKFTFQHFTDRLFFQTLPYLAFSNGESCGVENFGGNILRDSVGLRQSGSSFTLNGNDRFSERAKGFFIKKSFNG
ncbi:MAG: hypothetical protein BGO07_01475 [Alphaproteobacteria bacterium 40-19]|nr:MAG: hypothetical protein BGO07_01475 [Alphaproteobacteria bacterium 40-19]